MNYDTDARVVAGRKGDFYSTIDAHKMRLTVKIYDGNEDVETEVEFPFEWVVCSLCNGAGKHVNPSIDCNGISAEDFNEDPDFREEYFSGAYDQQCNRCGGRTTAPQIDESLCNDEQKKYLALWQANLAVDAEYDRISAAERRMGC